MITHSGLNHIFEVARERGFLSGSPIATHITHAERFAVAIANCFGESHSPLSFIDLGSGAGLPGIPLALMNESISGILVDSSTKRSDFLEWAISECTLQNRLSALCGRAEDLARTTSLREKMDIVVARAFGAPGVVAECGIPFLRLGGFMLVSEPPEPNEKRWTEEKLEMLGVKSSMTSNLKVFEKMISTPDKFPRRSGMPGKRPLF